MSFIPEALSPEEQRFKELARSQERREKAERAERDQEQKEKSLEHRRAYLEYIKSRKRREDTPKIEMGSISDTPITPTGTATATVIRGLGSYAGAALSAGAKAARAAMKKRREERAKKAAKAAEAASEAQRERTQAAMAQSTKLLPPARPFMTGKEKKTAISQGRYLGHNEVSEEFSCWREEFLYELGEMRRNKKQKNAEERIIDVMKGENKITIGPNESQTGINEGRKLSRLKTTVKKIAQKAEIPLLATSFALSAGQSPEALIRSGHIEGPGIAGMQRLMDPKKKPKDLDLGRVSHSARNKKLGEELSREELLKAIVLKLINEKKRKNSLLNNQYIGEETAAWTRKEGKNPTGGLNKKGVASYRRENPGSNLQTAVTTSPSKLKPNSKAAKRRKSFCARSAGQMKMWPKAAKDPNSRLRLARRKWNC